MGALILAEPTAAGGGGGMALASAAAEVAAAAADDDDAEFAITPLFVGMVTCLTFAGMVVPEMPLQSSPRARAVADETAGLVILPRLLDSDDDGTDETVGGESSLQNNRQDSL